MPAVPRATRLAILLALGAGCSGELGDDAAGGRDGSGGAPSSTGVTTADSGSTSVDASSGSTLTSTSTSTGAGGAGGSGEGGGEDGPLPYPTRSAYRIKAIQPDGWPDKEGLAANQTGGVAMNIVWQAWEPSVKAPPCAAGQQEYDGHCFTPDPGTDADIKVWTDRGVVVTAVVYGVPPWARVAGCSPISKSYEVFCAPKNGADYGRFVGALARRYDGKHGHGRVADFVIHNEVNSNVWYDVGCGQGKACDPNAWVANYASSYVAAYDVVAKEQPTAKVLVSLDHHFGPELEAPSAHDPILSGARFLERLAKHLGGRPFRVAFHPYPPDLLAAKFSADDWPKVTYGNIGALAGFLRKTFPNMPEASEIQLTESGVNSIGPQASEAAQAAGVCDSFRNVLGTPGIENYIYHRLRDHPTEVAAGLAVGLRRADKSAKPAWSTWALANRFDLDPPQLSCGFEHLPYVRLSRSLHPSRGHWASSRLPPPGFKVEKSWRLFRDPEPGTAMLYECAAGGHNLLTKNPACEGLRPMGPVGYAYVAAKSGAVPLYRCRVGAGSDHFVSNDPDCEGQVKEQLLGYALP